MRICILQGHPTAGTAHYGHRLAAAYAEGASVGGHQVKTVAVAELDFPLLRLKTDWDQGPPPPAIREAQAAIKMGATHSRSFIHSGSVLPRPFSKASSSRPCDQALPWTFRRVGGGSCCQAEVRASS